MNGADLLLGPALHQKLGNTPALINDNGIVTYQQLSDKAARTGSVFSNLGLGKGDRVLLIIADCPQFYYAYLGAMKIGAVPIALNLRLSQHELCHIIQDCTPKLIIIDADYGDLVSSAINNMSHPPTIIISAHHDHPTLTWAVFDDLLSSHLSAIHSADMNGNDTALWMYTSGTTGKPKAVVHRLSSLIGVEVYLQQVYGLKPGQRIYCTSKLFFAFALGHCLLAALRIGATIIINASWPSVETVSSIVETYKPQVMLSVPTMFRNLLTGNMAQGDAFKSINTFIAAGENLPLSLNDNWHKATGNSICEGIGATETLMMFMGASPDDELVGATGKPLPGIQISLRDERGNIITVANQPGEAWVKSKHLATQYWQQPEQTAEKFTGRWYHTGDVFICDDQGRYFHRGRADDMLKISGQWVSPVEIEECVLQHDHIEQAGVVGIKNADHLIRLALCLVTTKSCTDFSRLENELTEMMKAKLAIYKCPRRFLYLPDFPKTATGKLQRYKLRECVINEA